MPANKSIHFTRSFNSHFSSFLGKYKYHRIIIFIDYNVFKYHSKNIKIALNNNNVIYETFEVKEKSKNLESFSAIINFLIKNKADKETIVFSIGGGVLSDLIGFASSTYMRGLKYVNIPTTLLSQVDSSIGGKTGVNYAGYKNLLGSFYKPNDIIISFEFLKSLPPLEYLNGFGEVVKYGLLDTDMFLFLLKNIEKVNSRNLNTLEILIKKCVEIKSRIVEKDFKDHSSRRFLNLGHTFAHAIESMSMNKISHGIAVSFGLRIALSISAELYKFPKEKINSVNYILNYLGFSETLNMPLKKDTIMKYIRLDKKIQGNDINYILLKNIGEPFIEKNINEIYIEKALNTVNGR